MKHFDVVVVGAGHGGAQTCIVLRQAGFPGSIALIGAEPDLPYERPPLSKEYLLGERPLERLLIRPAGFWTEREVMLLPNTRIDRVDAIGHRVRSAAGEWFSYGRLVWAAGGEPRRLSCEGAGLAGVHVIRTRGDVDRLSGALAATSRVVIVGGGYVGLEAAAVLTKLGKQVTIVEVHGRVLARVAGEALSHFFEGEHRARGVDLRLGASVARLEGETGVVSGVRLNDGALIPADMVIVGIGIVPAAGPLVSAGAQGENGVLVDAQCRTSLPDIFAVGDCAAHASRFARGAVVRVESVQNANDQATVAAKVIAGGDAAYDTLPWFWSVQYDLKLQTVGLSTGHDAAAVRGDPAARSFSVIYLRQGRVIALDCVNAVRDYVQGRALVLAGAEATPERLADVSVPLKELDTF